MAGQMINSCTKFEDPTSIHPWVMSYDISCSIPLTMPLQPLCMRRIMWHMPPPEPYYGPFSETTWVSRCQKKASSGLMVLGRITRGRHTDNPGGRHCIRTNQQSTSIIPPSFPLDTLPVATLLIYPGLGRHRNMLDCIPLWLVTYA